MSEFENPPSKQTQKILDKIGRKSSPNTSLKNLKLEHPKKVWEKLVEMVFPEKEE